jgi:hypothetical protein
LTKISQWRLLSPYNSCGHGDKNFCQMFALSLMLPVVFSLCSYLILTSSVIIKLTVLDIGKVNYRYL